MGKIVHARLDDKTHALLEKIRLRTGLSQSEVLRRGLLSLGERSAAGPSPLRIVGLGRFASGRTDLGSNKRHLRGFGTK